MFAGLKGRRTYLTIIAMIFTAALGVIESGGVVILSPEITLPLTVLLGALATYFRHEA